jgi:hypothetical protein
MRIISLGFHNMSFDKVFPLFHDFHIYNTAW